MTDDCDCDCEPMYCDVCGDYVGSWCRHCGQYDDEFDYERGWCSCIDDEEEGEGYD